MPDSPRISIIIRTRNEERWIGTCLSGVFSQSRTDFEVVLVDNDSTDHTVQKAEQFELAEVVRCDEYRPGKALNLGIRSSRGEFIVCLSGHCIPVDEQWLENLVRNLDDPGVGAAYGRQEPLAFTPDADKRDLAIAFGLDRKVQAKDSFFHNASSVIRRSLWQEIPFREDVTNIEDRIWAKEILQRGYKIIYEPESRVYHHHGIHQDGDAERCANVVRILESIEDIRPDPLPEHVQYLNVVALVPVRGPVQELNGRPLVEYTIEQALRSERIRRVIVSTDDPELARIAEKCGAEAPFIRPSELSKDYVDIEQVLQHTLAEVESRGDHPDLIVSLEVTFPFRPAGLLDSLVEDLAGKGIDSVVAAKLEIQSIWKQDEDGMTRIDAGYIPRKYKEPTYIGYKGLGCVTHPDYIRQGHLIGPRVGFFEIENQISFLEVRGDTDFKFAEKLMPDWLIQQEATATQASSRGR